MRTSLNWLRFFFSLSALLWGLAATHTSFRSSVLFLRSHTSLYRSISLTLTLPYSSYLCFVLCTLTGCMINCSLCLNASTNPFRTRTARAISFLPLINVLVMVFLLCFSFSMHFIHFYLQINRFN